MRGTLKEFLPPFAKKCFALRYKCNVVFLMEIVVMVMEVHFNSGIHVLQKEKAKNLKRHIIKYLESQLRSQQQVRCRRWLQWLLLNTLNTDMRNSI